MQPNDPNQPSEEAQWSKIQKAGVFPHIATFSKYRELFVAGIVQANLLVQNALDQNLCTPDWVGAIHLTIFDEIHPWAGTFRQPGESVFFDGGMVGVEPVRIVGAIDAAAATLWTGLQQPDRNAQQTATLLAEFHGTLRRIHAFKDGNTRTSAVLIEAQINQVFGIKPRPALSSQSLKPLLALAYQGDTLPLANMILIREGYQEIAVPEGYSSKGKYAVPYDTDNETEFLKRRAEILRKQQGL